jgi:hypothetical protein
MFDVYVCPRLAGGFLILNGSGFCGYACFLNIRNYAPLGN